MGRLRWCLLLTLLGGCVAPSAESEGDPVPRARRLLDDGRANEARLLLEPLDQRTGAAEVVLVEAWRRLGREDDALSAYWRARDSNDPSARRRANLALGEIALAHNDPYLARSHLADAERDMVAGAPMEARLHVAQARAWLALGDQRRARELRALGDGADVEGLEVLDRELALTADSPEEPPPDGPPAPAQSSPEPVTRRPHGVPSPGVLMRHSWRARPVQARGNPEPMGGVSRITLHHTATKRLPATTRVSNAALLRSLQADHQNGRRWADIGYHFVIDRQGRVWEGRELRWQGAHAGSRSANRHNVGVALVGDFDRYRPTPAQKKSLTSLVRWLCSAHGVAPGQIRGHGQVLKAHTGGGTACPGRHLSAYISSLRRAVTADRTAAAGL